MLNEHNKPVVDYLLSIGMVAVIEVSDNQGCPDRCQPYVWRNRQLSIREELKHNHGHCYKLTLVKEGRQYPLIPLFWNSLKSRYQELAHGSLREYPPNSTSARPARPTAYDILSNVLIDRHANQMTFEEWATDYGYSDDSIKAQGIYQECINTALMLQRLFTAEQLEQLSELCQ